VQVCDVLRPGVPQRSDRRADRGKTQKLKFAKFEISKIANRKNQNLKNFYCNFFHEIDHESVPRKIVFLFPSSRARLSALRFLASFASFAMCEVQT
jgi:hypothetical protein